MLLQRNAWSVMMRSFLFGAKAVASCLLAKLNIERAVRMKPG
jgi:hypothetical protein